MPSKKKKYNSRFPPARIKKIMQTDDDIGKVAAAVPVLISKCLEMFLTSILSHTGEVTKSKRAKTMSTSHLKECIMNVGMFDFLKEVVADVPDMQNEDEATTSAGPVASEETKKLIRKRNTALAKPPKKRIKLENASYSASEENENTESGDDASCDEKDEGPNGSLGASSQAHTGKSIPPVARPSFHIPLDDLMSTGGNSALNTDHALQIVTPEREKKVEILKSDSFDENRSSSSNGLSSPQNPMDLSVVTAKQAAVASKTDIASINTEAPQNIGHSLKQQYINLTEPKQVKGDSSPSVAAKQAGISNPLNMPHLYNPMSVLPPPLPCVPPPTGPPKDLTKIPQGGMLSFLYSSYPGDPPLPGLPPHPPSSLNSPPFQPESHYQHVIEHNKPPGNPDTAYPYNPIAEHHKRLTSSLPHPYMPDPSHMQGVVSSAKPLKLPQAKEDDDYDT